MQVVENAFSDFVVLPFDLTKKKKKSGSCQVLNRVTAREILFLAWYVNEFCVCLPFLFLFNGVIYTTMSEFLSP
ncbi:hypothetical protein Bca52824_052589 [Brassica carinata]|uniref:Uncharacterized protein n=1 Tax=Brassica carinata TaxID=52824 RepID=A0A8X7UK31_BRACI|nr:hypothetical protein Bca52824_052589 [Brassica carinata]